MPDMQQAVSDEASAGGAPLPLTPYHTALRSLFVMAFHKGVQLLPERFSDVTESDTMGSVVGVLEKAGLRGKVLTRCKWPGLAAVEHAFPVMTMLKNGNWVIVVSIVTNADGAVVVGVLDPQRESEGIKPQSRETFLKSWGGTLILCEPNERKTEEIRPFGLAWFLPEIMRHRKYLADVALLATMTNIVAFSTPLMFQLLVDKVITHRSYQTLTSLMLIFGVLMLFDSLFNYSRQSLMLFVTNKIDATLASRTFQKLLNLPMDFFESKTTGVVTKHMQQTESIRGFLTGRLFTTLIDATALPLMIAMLVLYSAHLTAVVMCFTVLIAAVIGVMVPAFQRRLELLYAAEGARQGHLVETIHGMRTVKSLALEPMRMVTWDNSVARSVRRRATVAKISIVGSVLTQTLDKTMQISILGLGVIEVFNGNLSMGALIAFNMIASRVTGPLVQMVGLINQYQEVALSVKMLGVVMQHPPEREPGHAGMAPPITGRMAFDDVTFRYQSTASAVLDRVSFHVEAGQVIGIVGRSGSGKTTITRLIQGLHTVGEGVIRLDGVDIRHIDLPHLRRSIGVVLQDNFLFRGTIRDNIAAANPNAQLADIVEAARMAGAAEFIDRQPQSYQTWIEEGGSNFSGGQRQRLAIARALLTQPRLLIFDEATSALDPESEAIIQTNLDEIARGRTLIIVSHRLTSLTQSDAILMLDQGRMLDFAPHRVLLERCESYSQLWHQQTRFLQ
jgi:ATP-binding cassette subfamily B protein